MTRRTFFMANNYCHDFNENHKEERFYYVPRIRRITRYFKNLVVVKPNTLLCYNLKFKRVLILASLSYRKMSNFSHFKEIEYHVRS